jgi:hypothetical protein
MTLNSYLPWVLGLSPEALGRRLTRHPGTTSRSSGAPSGLVTLERFSQGNALSSHGPMGRRPDSTHIQAFGKYPNCRLRRDALVTQESDAW